MITTVSSVSALNTALKAAQAGDTIQLAPGTYTGFSAANLTFAQDVTITSADPLHQAVLTNFNITSVTGLTVSGVEMMTTGGPNSFDFLVKHSNDIHFDHVSVHGSLNATSDDANGISFSDGSDISVTNSEFQQLGRAMAISTSSNVTVSGNTVHDMRTDGFDFAQVDHVTISGNNLSNFHPNATDHPDAIQFWTSGTTAPSHDITISGNVIAIGNGSNSQGIFFRDQLGNMPYANVKISDNLIDGTGYNGIRIGHVNGLTLTDNQLTTNPGNNVETFFAVSDSDHVTSTNNSAVSIGFPNATNVIEIGDRIVGVSADYGNANLATWLHAHGMDALYASLANTSGGAATGDPAPVAQTLDATTLNLTLTGSGDVDGYGNALGNVITGNLGDNHLYGMAGNDTMDGGTGGADILSGGLGNDLYYIQNGSDVVLENTGEGADTVIAKGNFILPSNVENLIINATVTNSWAGTGNTLNNVLTGNAGANALNGMAGADTLIGGGGDDRLTGGPGSDKFVFAVGAGHDVVMDFGSVGDRDVLDLSALYAKGFQATLSETSAGVTLSFGNGDTIMLQGQHISTLHATPTGFVS